MTAAISIASFYYKYCNHVIESSFHTTTTTVRNIKQFNGKIVTLKADVFYYQIK